MTEHKRILIVEDESAVQQLLSAALSPHGWLIESALNGTEAIGRIRSLRYDLVIADLGLPDIDGIEFLGRLHREQPEAKSIVITGESTPARVLDSLRNRACAYFKKPFRPEEIASAVAAALEHSGCEDDIQVLSAVPAWITLRVRCKVETAERLLQFLRQMETGLPDAERDMMAAAFREVLLNAIEHGGKSDPEKWLDVACIHARRMLLYHVRDPGEGFSFEGLTHAAVSNNEDDPLHHASVREEQGLRPGGFGILLARNLVDEMMYNEKGNEVLLVKYRRG